MTRFSVGQRCFLGFAALGAALIHLALAIGSPPWLAVALVVVGAPEFLWGVLTVSRPGPPILRVAIAGALLPGAGWILLLATGIPDGPRPLPMIAATVLDLAVAVGIAVRLRAAPRPEPSRPALGIVVAGVIVGALTVPALIASETPQLQTDLAPTHEESPH